MAGLGYHSKAGKFMPRRQCASVNHSKKRALLRPRLAPTSVQKQFLYSGATGAHLIKPDRNCGPDRIEQPLLLNWPRQSWPVDF